MPIIENKKLFIKNMRYKNYKDYNLTIEELINIIENLNTNKCNDCNNILKFENYKPKCYYQFCLTRIDNKNPKNKDNLKLCCYFCGSGGHKPIKDDKGIFFYDLDCENNCCLVSEEHKLLIEKINQKEEIYYEIEKIKELIDDLFNKNYELKINNYYDNKNIEEYIEIIEEIIDNIDNIDELINIILLNPILYENLVKLNNKIEKLINKINILKINKIYENEDEE